MDDWEGTRILYSKAKITTAQVIERTTEEERHPFQRLSPTQYQSSSSSTSNNSSTAKTEIVTTSGEAMPRLDRIASINSIAAARNVQTAETLRPAR